MGEASRWTDTWRFEAFQAHMAEHSDGGDEADGTIEPTRLN